jgi:hypothetical protein
MLLKAKVVIGQYISQKRHRRLFREIKTLHVLTITDLRGPQKGKKSNPVMSGALL